ncbi:MFS transporter [Francisellaceae bacterium]|nr:MFS transporter [Francisellaceae bacterium]
MQLSKKVIVSTMVGNIAEWYEFYIYGMFAAPIIAKLFLPQDSGFIALLYAYTAFAVGFLMRPIGAIILGYFGDKYGRKKTLVSSLLLMGIPTILMAILPTYAAIGILAPLLLMIIRILQGLAVGGEIGGATSFILEHSPTNKKNLSSALLISSSFIALLLASFASYLMTTIFSVQQLQDWAWRIPFVFGLVIIITGLYVRTRTQETEAFKKLKSNHQISHNPIIESFRDEWKNMLRTFLMSPLIAVLVFMGFAYMPAYTSTYLNYDFSDILWQCSIGMITLIISCVFFGLIADRFGGKKLLIWSSLILIISVIPIYYGLAHYPELSQLIIIIFTLISGAVIAPIFANTSGLFKPKLRYTGFGISFNISVAIFGGSAPLIMTYLITKTQINLIPAYYIIVLGIIFIATCITLPNKK